MIIKSPARAVKGKWPYRRRNLPEMLDKNPQLRIIPPVRAKGAINILIWFSLEYERRKRQKETQSGG